MIEDSILHFALQLWVEPKAPSSSTLNFAAFCVILSVVLPINGKRFVPLLDLGRFLPPDLYRKGGCQMVTYSDLIQTGILIVGIIALFIQANKKK